MRYFSFFVASLLISCVGSEQGSSKKGNLPPGSPEATTPVPDDPATPAPVPESPIPDPADPVAIPRPTIAKVWVDGECMAPYDGKCYSPLGQCFDLALFTEPAVDPALLSVKSDNGATALSLMVDSSFDKKETAPGVFTFCPKEEGIFSLSFAVDAATSTLEVRVVPDLTGTMWSTYNECGASCATLTSKCYSVTGVDSELLGSKPWSLGELKWGDEILRISIPSPFTGETEIEGTCILSSDRWKMTCETWYALDPNGDSLVSVLKRYL